MSIHPDTSVVGLDQCRSGLLDNGRSEVPSESVATVLVCQAGQALRDTQPRKRTESVLAQEHVLTSSSSFLPSFSLDLLDVDTNDDPDEPEELELFAKEPIRNLHEKPLSSLRSTTSNPQSLDPPLFSQPQERFHCALCRKTFACRTSARGHRKMNTCRNQEVPCSVDHEHQPVRLQFDSMADALNWSEQNQLDRFFVFKTRKSTNGVPGSYRIMHCNQNAKDITTGTKKSKKACVCLAKITFNQKEICCCKDHQSEWCFNAKQQVLVYGCLQHSHPLDRKNFRISKTVKQHTADLLTSGIRSDVVIDKYLSTNDEDPYSKPVTYRDVYRIKKSCNLEGYDEKASEVENVTNMLTDGSFHGFNFGKQFDMAYVPEDIACKVVETSGFFLLTYASPEMLERFRNHSATVSIDGTHGTNAAKFVLISVLVFDRRGEGSPVFQALVENENQTVFSAALRVLKSLAPDACADVKTVLSDTSHTFINSWREIINPGVMWNVCHWHLEKNWAKRIKNPEMFNDIKSLRQLAELDPFTEQLVKIQSK